MKLEDIHVLKFPNDSEEIFCGDLDEFDSSELSGGVEISQDKWSAPTCANALKMLLEDENQHRYIYSIDMILSVLETTISCDIDIKRFMRELLVMWFKHYNSVD